MASTSKTTATDSTDELPNVLNTRCDCFQAEEETFFILGAFAGHTNKKVKRLIEECGNGKVITDITKVSLRRVIVSPALWSSNGTGAMSLTIKSIMSAKKGNLIDDEDEDDTARHIHRVWLLPLEWVYACLEAEELLPEADWDLEFSLEAEREKRAQELVLERKLNCGQSKFARGERKRLEREAEIRRTVKEFEALEKLEENERAEESSAAVASAIAASSAQSIQDAQRRFSVTKAAPRVHPNTTAPPTNAVFKPKPTATAHLSSRPTNFPPSSTTLAAKDSNRHIMHRPPISRNPHGSKPRSNNNDELLSLLKRASSSALDSTNSNKKQKR